MVPEGSLLAELADSVADGIEVDWSKVESSAKTPAERELIAQFRLLARVQALQDVDGLGREPLPSPPLSSNTDPARQGPPSPVSPRVPDEATETATVAAPVYWGHLEIVAPVGRGTFGTVFRAWDPNLQREVALKLVEPDAGASTVESTVINEARLLARVRHPNVVSIYGADQANGQVGLWMEFIRGRTLRQIVETSGPFSPREAVGICLELARALAAVHAAGLVHRDIKAQNVMREDGGRVVLMDFGAGVEAEASVPWRLAGTPLYMAPELVEGARATPRSDVYSLGVLLFYLVTGTHPITANAIGDLQAAHREGRRKLLRDLKPDAPVAFVQCVEQLIDADPLRRIQTAGAAEAALQGAIEPTKRRPGALLAIAASVIAAVVLLGAGIGPLWNRLVGGGPLVRSVAVLPMVNLSGDPDREYFVDGMTDLLIAELSRISSLRVTARTSIMRYKKTTKRLDDIARELDVDAVLEASVMLAGSQLRLTASLIRPSDQKRLWGQSYEQPIRDAFVLQATMARDLAEGVRLAITPEERRDLQNTYTASQEAQDLYLRGRFVFHLLDRNRAKEACTLFEQAVKLDPKYALAWAGLSRCYAFLETSGLLTPAVAWPLVLDAAARAVAEDDALAEAHTALADARFKFDWDWRAARDSFERAISLNPSYSLARDLFSRLLAAAGLTSEAVDQARRGVESDPQSAERRRTLALMLFYQRRYAEALQRIEEAAALDPTFSGSHVVRARTLAALGGYDEALQSLRQAVSLASQPAVIAELGRIHASAGRSDEALAALKELPGAVGPDGFAHSQDAAYILAALGRRDEALTRLEQAVDEHSSRILWLRVDPRVDSLRRHPRFTTLLARIGGLD